MDEQFRPIYDDIYAARTAPSRALRAFDERLTLGQSDVSLVRDAIETAEHQEPNGRRLREDAKAFLAVNFQDLVVAPIKRAGAAPDHELASDVKHDVFLLVSAASSDPATGPGAEISGHAIVDSLSRNWADLRISRFRLWEQTK